MSASRVDTIVNAALDVNGVEDRMKLNISTRQSEEISKPLSVVFSFNTIKCYKRENCKIHRR